jgi:hypothetical protein
MMKRSAAGSGSSDSRRTITLVLLIVSALLAVVLGIGALVAGAFVSFGS